MRKHLIAAATAAILLGSLGTGIAAAEPPTPGGGPAFGQHVASMTPDHPQDHGAMFGECVSAMARGEGCPHHAE